MIVSAQGSDGQIPRELQDQLMLLIQTPAGTVVLDRDFGINTACVDTTMGDVARTMIAAELAEKMERYIPCLSLREVIMEGGEANGEMRLRVVVDYDGQSV